MLYCFIIVLPLSKVLTIVWLKYSNLSILIRENLIERIKPRIEFF